MRRTGRTDTGTVPEACGIQWDEGRYGTDTYTRIDKRKTAETLSGGVLLPVGMTGHCGRLQGYMDRGRPRAAERQGKGQGHTVEPAIHKTVYQRQARGPAG